jgi:hypothetical protein
MNIRAKMRCSQVTKTEYGAECVKLSAVYGNGEENKSFAKATPCATVDMQIDNPDAQGAFVPGGEYYVDFAPAFKPAIAPAAEQAAEGKQG